VLYEGGTGDSVTGASVGTSDGAAVGAGDVTAQSFLYFLCLLVLLY